MAVTRFEVDRRPSPGRISKEQTTDSAVGVYVDGVYSSVSGTAPSHDHTLGKREVNWIRGSQPPLNTEIWVPAWGEPRRYRDCPAAGWERTSEGILMSLRRLEDVFKTTCVGL